MDPNTQNNNNSKEDAVDERIFSYVKIKQRPPLYEIFAPAWFRALEAWFDLEKISTTRTKYIHALSQLPIEVLDRIPQPDVVAEDYDRLKKAVTLISEETRLNLFDEFLSKQNYGLQPSVYLREMLIQADKLNVGEDKVRLSFLKTLPSPLRITLASQTTLTLQELAELADFSPRVANHNTTTTTTTLIKAPSHSNDTPDNLKTPFFQNRIPKICMGHIFHGQDSNTCEPWCKWPNNTEVTILSDSRPPSRSSSPLTPTPTPTPSTPSTPSEIYKSVYFTEIRNPLM